MQSTLLRTISTRFEMCFVAYNSSNIIFNEFCENKTNWLSVATHEISPDLAPTRVLRRKNAGSCTSENLLLNTRWSHESKFCRENAF